MPSQFFGLNISYSGLIASNAALNTTANNIANAETEGYSRQQVKTAASEALRAFATYGCAGAGVDTLGVERLRSEYYDTRYRNNNSNLGEYEVKQKYMKMLENHYADDDYTEGFNTIFNNLFNSMQEVMKNAGDTTYKQAFVKDAISLTEYFNSMSASLKDMQKDLNSEIYATVEQLNSYATEIASLNKQINVIEISGGTANELRDQRDLLIDKISKVVDVTTEETPVYDPYNPGRETGASRFIVKIAGGQTIVDSDHYNELVCKARSNAESVNQSDIDGLYDIYWENGNTFDLNNASLKGTLRGLIDMRDGNNNEYFHGTITSIGQTADQSGVNHQTVTVKVDASYLKDINKSNLSESGKILLGNQVSYYDSFSFKYDADTDTYSYEFVLSDTTKNPEAIGTSKIGMDSSVGLANGYQGIPYYMQQMSEWVRDFAQAFDTILTQDGSIDDYGDPARKLFVANNRSSAGEYDCVEIPQEGVSYTISCSDNSYYKMTAETFTVADAIERNAALLATHTDKYAGQDKFDVVEQLIDLHTNKDKMEFRGCTASEFLQCILGDVMLNASNANTFGAKFEDLGNTIDTMRLSVSSVDKDEEAVSLVKYQNAYTLASKMISCFTEIYDRLILETGV